MKKILIIGGAGYVGTPLQTLLADSGYEVTVFDTFWYYQNLTPPRDSIKYICADVRDIHALEKALENQDACIHLACISNDPSYELDEKLSREINYEAFSNFIAITNKSSLKRLIFASSSSVYGVKKESKVTEELSCEPLTDYSRFKVECEKLITNQLSQDITAVILRPSTICGYSQRQRFDLVVNLLTLSAITSGIINVDGGEQFRPNLHIDEMVSCYKKILESPSEIVDRQILNVAGENLKVAEIAEKIRNIVGQKCRIDYKPIIDARSYRVSGEKIKSLIGFTPAKNVDDAVQDLVTAFSKNMFPDWQSSRYYNIKKMKELINQKKV